MAKAKQSEEVKSNRALFTQNLRQADITLIISLKIDHEDRIRRYEKQQFPRGSKLSKFDDKPKCMRCLGNPPRKLCPASDSTCNKCSKKGRNRAKACRNGENWASPSKHLNEISQQSSDEETYFLGAIATPDELNNPWVTNLQ